MAYRISNFARMSLVQSVAAAATTMFVSPEDGDLLPTLVPGDTAPAVLFNRTDQEIVYITAESNGQLTVTRAQEATVAQDWPSGTVIIHTPTAALFELLLNAAVGVATFVGAATNVGNAYEVDVGVGSPIPGLSDGERVSFIIPADNIAGGVTLTVTNGSSTTASKSILHDDGRALKLGDFQADWVAEVRFSTDHDAWMLTTDTSFQEEATQINSGPVPGINRHPNGRVDAWNGGTSFSSPVTLSETADGWYVEHDGTIGTFTVNRQAFTLGQSDVPGDPRYFLRWDHSSAGVGSTIRRLWVPIPGVGWRGGEQVTRSVWLKADAARNVTAKLIQRFGTGGAPSADVQADSDVLALTTSWQRFDITTTLPSIVGKTIGSNLDDALILTLDLPLNTTMTIDVAMDDLRQGDIPGDQSDTFPVSTKHGGTGGSFENLNDIASSMTNVVHIDGTETITGAKTFSQDVTVSEAGPRYILEETDQAADEKRWDLAVSAGDLLIRSRTDADGAGINALSFIRGVGTAVSQALFDTVVALPNGSAAAPALIMPGLSAATGLYTAAGEFAFAWAGVAHVFWGATRMRIVPAVELSAGAVGTPSLYHTTDSNSGRYWIGADNIGESTNGVLRFDWNTTRLQIGVGFDVVMPLAAVAPTSVFSVGFRGAPVVSGNSAYAFPATDAGHTIYHDEAGARTYTIPANGSVPHPIGTVFILDNTGNSGAAGTITLNITTDTLRRGDGVAGTGSRSVLASQVAFIRKVAAQIWIITGNFS